MQDRVRSHLKVIMAPQKTSKNKGIAAWRWLLLLLVAWPGPRPVVHSHQHLVQRAATADFGSHLALFHANQSRQLPPWQLHVHWSFGDCTIAHEQVVAAAADTITAAPSLPDDAFAACELAIESDGLMNHVFSARPEWLAIDSQLTSVPAGRLWLQLCGAWTC